MTGATTQGRHRVLDPPQRSSEILFGLIMVLSFTGSIGAATAGREEIRTMLFGALGCNLAWGLVDGVMYILDALIERSRALTTVKAIRAATRPEAARGLIAAALPEFVATRLRPGDIEHLREEIGRLPDLPPAARLTWIDVRGAIGVFLLVFLSTFPVAVPFMVIGEPRLALRVSNGVAIALLFLLGHKMGGYSGLPPFRCGLAMVGIGVALVLITMALGG